MQKHPWLIIASLSQQFDLFTRYSVFSVGCYFSCAKFMLSCVVMVTGPMMTSFSSGQWLRASSDAHGPGNAPCSSWRGLKLGVLCSCWRPFRPLVIVSTHHYGAAWVNAYQMKWLFRFFYVTQHSWRVWDAEGEAEGSKLCHHKWVTAITWLQKWMK